MFLFLLFYFLNISAKSERVASSVARSQTSSAGEGFHCYTNAKKLNLTPALFKGGVKVPVRICIYMCVFLSQTEASPGTRSTPLHPPLPPPLPPTPGDSCWHFNTCVCVLCWLVSSSVCEVRWKNPVSHFGAKQSSLSRLRNEIQNYYSFDSNVSYFFEIILYGKIR